MKPKKGYKVTDRNMKCRGFQYKIGKRFKYNGKIIHCDAGFHYCTKLANCFTYYEFNPNNRVFEIVDYSDNTIEKKNKSVTDDIEFVRELNWHEVINLVNSGNGNSGYGNSGNWNSGNGNSGNRNSGNANSGYGNSGNWNSCYGNSGSRNSGNWNSGNGNSGNRNSGNANSGYGNSGNWNSGNGNSGNWNSGEWNSCNYSSGFFNTKADTVKIFNKDSGLTREQFNEKYVIPDCLYFLLCIFIPEEEMTEEEKKEYPQHKTTGGYLKTLTYKEAAKKSISNASEKDKNLIRALPNYDPDIFEEIFGIRI